MSEDDKEELADFRALEEEFGWVDPSVSADSWARSYYGRSKNVDFAELVKDLAEHEEIDLHRILEENEE